MPSTVQPWCGHTELYATNVPAVGCTTTTPPPLGTTTPPPIGTWDVGTVAPAVVGAPEPPEARDPQPHRAAPAQTAPTTATPRSTALRGSSGPVLPGSQWSCTSVVSSGVADP